MVARISTVAFIGMEAVPVDVQVMIAPGKMGMSIVGLPDKAVAESRERIQAAIHACGLSMPTKRVTINMAPADLPKEGSHYDLPIAVGLMAAMGVLPKDEIRDYLILGELSLDGTITSVAGILLAAITANRMNRGLICPQSCGSEAAWAGKDTNILAPYSLIALANHFKGTQVLSRPEPVKAVMRNNGFDLSEIKGQETAKRALEISAAGNHNLLMVGPPGSGKSMLAQRLISILPPLDTEELLEVSMVSSIAGTLVNGALSQQRPFRSPHHSASMAAMVGGGFKTKPGEVSLAHNGVLFLDELPEFSPQVLDSLRQPLETGEAVIARVNYRATYPARFQLIAAMNPCRCGLAGEAGHSCARGIRCQTDYQARISGPLLDRIDLRVDVPAVSALDLMKPANGETSAIVAARVAKARRIQSARYQALGLPAFTTNANCPTALVEEVAKPDKQGMQLLYTASEKMRFSARAYHRILKVARTLADLENSQTLQSHHLAEAITFRMGAERLNPATSS